ncbi:hypothetical protein HDU96_010381, partial [Phlyctochytrium bullatum]
MSNNFYIPTKNPANFFETINPPRRGQPWVVPPASILPPLPAISQPGFGCFVSPNATIGFPLFNASVPPDKVCGPGFFCPYYRREAPETWPVSCPADPVCQIARLDSGICLPQGRYEPVPCLSGFYCPDYKTILPCPEGYYCPIGVTSPIACQAMSRCPAGSSNEAHYGLLVIAVIADVFLFLAVLAKRIAEVRRAGMPLSTVLPPSLAVIAQKLRSRRRHQGKDPEVAARTNVEEGKVEPAIEGGGDESVEGRKMRERMQRLVAGFRAGMGGREATMEFSFSRLGLTLPSGKIVLEGVSGQIHSGRMTAIMGPSGAGKTTFMNVLMGKVPGITGELKINGVVEEMGRFKRLIGYVPQDDVMLQELTVREVIAHSGRCRLPRSWTSAEVESHVDNVISALGLDHVKNTQIGDAFTRGISGGQRKRVNVGMELAAVPSALFLDEPTSGLDSTSALDLAHILRATARLGLTIVSVIHQPRVEIFEAFDDVLLIAPG